MRYGIAFPVRRLSQAVVDGDVVLFELNSLYMVVEVWIVTRKGRVEHCSQWGRRGDVFVRMGQCWMTLQSTVTLLCQYAQCGAVHNMMRLRWKADAVGMPRGGTMELVPEDWRRLAGFAAAAGLVPVTPPSTPTAPAAATKPAGAIKPRASRIYAPIPYRVLSLPATACL